LPFPETPLPTVRIPIPDAQVVIGAVVLRSPQGRASLRLVLPPIAAHAATLYGAYKSRLQRPLSPSPGIDRLASTDSENFVIVISLNPAGL
jgi:hypothetical protein